MSMAFTDHEKCSYMPQYLTCVLLLLQQKKKRLLKGSNSKHPEPKIVLPSPPSQAKISNFFQELSKTGKPVFLSIIPEYCDDYIVDHSQYSLPLSNLFDPEAMKLSYTDLLLKCEDIFSSISVTNDQATNIELSTRDQSKCKAWFRFRAGRITASKFKAAVARTDYTQPSVSLVKRIFFSTKPSCCTKATKWGCDHEQKAREAYFHKAVLSHLNLTLTDRGLVIHPQYPHLGASSDGFIKCRCCGNGVLEDKCPFSCKDRSFLEAIGDRNFCLEKSENDTFVLKKITLIIIKYNSK